MGSMLNCWEVIIVLCGHGIGEAAKGIYASVTQTADDLYEDILPAVNSTVDTLDKFHSAMTYMTLMVVNVTELLRECELDTLIDPGFTMIEGLEHAEKGLRGGIDILREKRGFAETDVDLQGDNETRVIGAYDRAIVALGGLHDATIDFRWAIMERDANLESPSHTTSSSVVDLVTRLEA